MGQEVANSEVEAEGLPDHDPPAPIKRVEHSYTRELLLSFADLEGCKKRPENLDPVVWRDAPAADGVDGGIAIPVNSSRGLVRRDSEAFSKSPVDIPEWRKDSWRSGGTGALVPPGPRRKPYDEEPPGNAFSTSYPPRPAGNWGDSHQRNTFERSVLQGQGSGRWEHRAGLPDRERESGRPFQKWDGEETVAAPIVPLDALRPEVPRPFGSVGSVVRPGWLPAERDGLLGSGGVLHRTYTGNFTSALRAPERQMSMGVPERQMSLGVPERQMGMGPPERQMGMGLPERPVGIGPPERQMSMGPPERQMSMGPPERQMSMGPLERQMSMGLPERQNSFGRGAPRNSEPYQPARPSKGPPFARREETDLVNDETFGSEISSADDRTEQERKRREAFELMRKDHQRLLHKQQKLISQKHEERLANPESNASRKHDESSLWDSSPSSDVVPSSPPGSPLKRSPDTEISSGLVSTPVVAPATPRPAIPPGFAKVVPHKQQLTRKASFAPENPLEGDNVQAKDILKPTAMQSESAALSQEKALGDDSLKEAGNLLPKVEEALEEPEPTDSSVAMLPAELLPTPPNEAQDDMSQPKRSVVSAGEVKQEWILPTEGILNDMKDGISSDEAKESSFVDVKELNSQESILDKLFGKSKLDKGSLNDGGLPTPALTEESQIRISKEDAWSEGDSKTSKFAQWFHQEENQSRESAVVSSDILSLFPSGGTLKASSNSSSEHVSGVQDGPQQSNSVNVPRNRGRILPMPTGPSLEDIEKGLKENASSGQEQGATKVPIFTGSLSLKSLDVELRGDHLSGVFGEHSPVGKFNFRSAPSQRKSASRSSPVFLTCEDIEQSMLAEAGTTEKSIPNLAQPSQAGGTPNVKDGQAADSAASRHLLSLLHKGAAGGKHSPENSWSSHTEHAGASGKAGVVDLHHDGEDLSGASKNSSSDNATLEALFGKAFMSDLRSTKAPLSANLNIGDYFGNADGPQAMPGMYPGSRQSAGRVNNLPANTDVLQQWPRSVGWNDGNGLEINRNRSLKDVTNGNQFVALDNEENHIATSSSHGLWGNGIASHISDGSLPSNAGVGNKGSFVSSSDSTLFMVGDLADNSVKGKGHLSRVHNSDLDLRKSSRVTGDGKVLPSGNFAPGQLRVSEDSSLPLSQGKVLSSDGPGIGPIAASESSGLPQVFNEDGLAKRLGDISTGKFGAGEPSAATARDENAAAASQGIEGFLLKSRSIDRKETLEDGLADDKIGLGDSGNPGIDRKAAESLSDTMGFIGKGKDANARASCIATAGFPDQANAGGLSRSSSNAVRFKNVGGAVQPTSPFNGFSVGPTFQHQQSLGAQHQQSLGAQHQQSLGGLYRSDSLPAVSRQQSAIAAQQHHLQQNPGAGLAMFPPQQFLPQPGLPQQQQLLARSFSNGSALEFPHLPFGHAPAPAQSRQLPGGHLHFPPAPHGHLSPPAGYPPMGPMGPPTPNHFLPPAQMPQRGPSMSPMGDGHMFMPDQSMHDPHGLGSKPGAQQGPAPLFPLGGHGLQSGQGPLFHQPPLPQMRGQQNQLMPGPVPWDLRSYSAELMRTSSKGHELSGFVNGSGGGANSLDRWFGMELSRNVSGIPTPGLLQVSPHTMDAESKVRFG